MFGIPGRAPPRLRRTITAQMQNSASDRRRRRRRRPERHHAGRPAAGAGARPARQAAAADRRLHVAAQQYRRLDNVLVLSVAREGLAAVQCARHHHPEAERPAQGGDYARRTHSPVDVATASRPIGGVSGDVVSAVRQLCEINRCHLHTHFFMRLLTDSHTD